MLQPWFNQLNHGSPMVPGDQNRGLNSSIWLNRPCYNDAESILLGLRSNMLVPSCPILSHPCQWWSRVMVSSQLCPEMTMNCSHTLSHLPPESGQKQFLCNPRWPEAYRFHPKNVLFRSLSCITKILRSSEPCVRNYMMHGSHWQGNDSEKVRLLVLRYSLRRRLKSGLRAILCSRQKTVSICVVAPCLNRLEVKSSRSRICSKL